MSKYMITNSLSTELISVCHSLKCLESCLNARIQKGAESYLGDNDFKVYELKENLSFDIELKLKPKKGVL